MYSTEKHKEYMQQWRLTPAGTESEKITAKRKKRKQKQPNENGFKQFKYLFPTTIICAHCNKELILKHYPNRKYHRDCKKELRKQKARTKTHNWYLKNKPKRQDYSKQHRIKNAKRIRERETLRRLPRQLTQQTIKELLTEQITEWRYQKHKQYIRGYEKRRYATEPLIRLMRFLRESLRGRIKNGIKRNIKRADLMPYTTIKLKEHLEKQFTKTMNWHNHGKKWEIDHTIPVAYCTKQYKTTNNIEYLKELCKLKNLRPLMTKANRQKHATINKTTNKLIAMMEKRIEKITTISSQSHYPPFIVTTREW